MIAMDYRIIEGNSLVIAMDNLLIEWVELNNFMISIDNLRISHGLYRKYFYLVV
jgi:hypothetical protein